MPGYVGERYVGIMVLGQNPAPTPKELVEQDQELFSTFDTGIEGNVATFRQSVRRVMSRHVPLWGPLRQMGFPEWGVEIQEIAYLNTVKCSSQAPNGQRSNAAPSQGTYFRCMSTYLVKHLHTLKPKIIVFRYSNTQAQLLRTLRAAHAYDDISRSVLRWVEKDANSFVFSGIQVSHAQRNELVPKIKRVANHARRTSQSIAR